MNLTDYRFDAFLEAFILTAKDMNIVSDHLEDAILVMNRVRSDVTSGCTVRMELARKRIQTDGLAAVYEKLGGKDGMDSVMQSLWDFSDRDKRICFTSSSDFGSKKRWIYVSSYNSGGIARSFIANGAALQVYGLC